MEGILPSGGGGPRPVRPLRPLSVGEVLDAAIKLYRANAVALWKIVAVIVIPISVVDQGVVAASLPSEAFVHNGILYTPTGRLSTPTAGVIVSLVLTVVGILLVNGSLALCLVDSYIGHPLDWLSSLRTAANRLGGLLWLAILWTVLVILGFIAIVLPGIWLVVVWSVSVPALMFEHLNGFKALGRSFDLVRGRWWATFAALLVAIIMLLIVSVVIGLILRLIEKGLKVDSTGLWFAFNFVIAVIGDLIVYPFIAAVISVIYIDLRVRKEALDLELLADNLGRPATALAGPVPAAPESGWPSSE